MSKKLYVTFNDSDFDPTYASVEGVEIVELEESESSLIVNETRRAPMVPKTCEEIRAFATLLGWEVTYFGNRLVLIP